jgi:LemA protein
VQEHVVHPMARNACPGKPIILAREKAGNMTTSQLIGTLSSLLAVGLLVYYVSIYNWVQRLINKIPEVASNITVLMKKRTDLISKLIAIVDAYGLHESGINVRVAGEFGGSVGPNQSRGVIERLASLRMAFPELKADSLYENLMQELAHVETDVADRREQYNSTVRAYNTEISQFPINLLLSPFGFQTKQFLSSQELSS